VISDNHYPIFAAHTGALPISFAFFRVKSNVAAHAFLNQRKDAYGIAFNALHL